MRDGWIFFITLHAFFRGLRNLAVSSAWVKLTKLSGSRSLQPVAVQDIIQSHINRYSNAWQHRWLACVRGAPMQGLPNWVSGLCIACPAFIAAMSIFHVSIHTNAQCKRNQRQKVLLYKKSIKKQINLNPPFFFKSIFFYPEWLYYIQMSSLYKQDQPSCSSLAQGLCVSGLTFLVFFFWGNMFERCQKDTRLFLLYHISCVKIWQVASSSVFLQMCYFN